GLPSRDDSGGGGCYVSLSDGSERFVYLHLDSSTADLYRDPQHPAQFLPKNNVPAATGQSSAFVSLRLDNGVGFQPDGSEVRNFAPQSGRTVVVGAEPLLEAMLSSNREPALILYGEPGPTYVIEGKPRWAATW